MTVTFVCTKILPTTSPVHILHNAGYDAADKVIGSLAAWKNLLRSIKPDLVLVDYCPGVLLALRGMTIPVASLSTGFDVPSNRSPWQPFGFGVEGRSRSASLTLRVGRRGLADASG